MHNSSSIPPRQKAHSCQSRFIEMVYEKFCQLSEFDACYLIWCSKLIVMPFSLAFRILQYIILLLHFKDSLKYHALLFPTIARCTLSTMNHNTFLFIEFLPFLLWRNYKYFVKNLAVLNSWKPFLIMKQNHSVLFSMSSTM